MADLDARWLTEALDRLNSTLQMIEPSLATIAEHLSDQPAPGRCGKQAPALIMGAVEWCSLGAGHAGWHQAENGTEWNDPDPEAVRAELDRLGKDWAVAIREAGLSREATERAVSKLGSVRALGGDLRKSENPLLRAIGDDIRRAVDGGEQIAAAKAQPEGGQ